MRRSVTAIALIDSEHVIPAMRDLSEDPAADHVHYSHALQPCNALTMARIYTAAFFSPKHAI